MRGKKLGCTSGIISPGLLFMSPIIVSALVNGNGRICYLKPRKTKIDVSFGR